MSPGRAATRPRHARRLTPAALALLLGAGALTDASAHLMVAGHGTLNIKEAGAWFVIAIPVSALTGVDDDGDGRLGLAELAAHNGAIESQVAAGLALRDDGGARPIQGLLINPSPDHGRPDEPVTHVVALGRFAPAPTRGALRLRAALFGSAPADQTLQVKVTRGTETDALTLTPQTPERELFTAPDTLCPLDGWGWRWLWVPTCLL
ncbi:MAG: hypothetical protein H6744_07825 [Deltaproteobacteria bacterium]|nr:hypothetical protein [Deltaproteobacteria bacterium]